VSDSTQCGLFVGDGKKMHGFGVTFSFNEKYNHLTAVQYAYSNFCKG